MRRGDPSFFTDEKFRKKNGELDTAAINAFYKEFNNFNQYGEFTWQAVTARCYTDKPNELNWREYRNYALENKKNLAYNAARKRANEEKLERERLAAANAANAKALKTANFQKKAGTREFASIYNICQNPFPYMGKALIFETNYTFDWKAVSPTSAEFIGMSCSFVLTGIPANLLTSTFNGNKVVAAKLLQKTNGRLRFQYIYHEMCTSNCYNF